MSAEPAPTPGPPARRRWLLAALAPWIVAVLALAWVVRMVRWSDFVRALSRVDAVPFAALCLGMLALNWAADAFAMQQAFAVFGFRSKWREMMIVRGASYLLAAFQYYVGQAAIVGFVYRRGVPLARATGWLLFISAVNFGLLLLLAAAGLVAAGLLVPALRPALAVVVVACLAYAALLRWKPARLVRTPVLGALFEAGIAGHLRALVARLPHVAVLTVWNILALRAFGVPVPPLVAVALLPVALFASALPVSAQGLGLAQYASIVLFSHYGGPDGRAAVLACSLSTSSIALIVQLTIGLLLLAPARRLGLREATIASSVTLSAEPSTTRPASTRPR